MGRGGPGRGQVQEEEGVHDLGGQGKGIPTRYLLGEGRGDRQVGSGYATVEGTEGTTAKVSATMGPGTGKVQGARGGRKDLVWGGIGRYGA